MRRFFALTGCLLALVAVGSARADIKPHALFRDGMVLQQEMACPVWGMADEGETVQWELKLKDSVVTDKDGVRPDKNGRWMFRIPAQKAGGPYTLTLKGKNTVSIKDVFVGEVWVCSGQSNMEWPMHRSGPNAEKDINASKNAMVRLYTVPKARADKPTTNVAASWKECDADTVKNFSAVGYFFGRDLQKALNVPVGLIHTSWGGTAAEEWTPREYLEKDEAFKNTLSNKNSTTLYNGMIAPLLPYAIKGAIWYQGESNAGRAHQYRTLFPTMIKAWRDGWKQGDFPFLFVQLAPFQAIVDQPQESAWAELREAQLLTLKASPNTGMAVITDVGNPKDIHPTPKEPVGARLALAARGIAYKEKIEYSGPVYDSLKVEGNKAILTFKHTGKGLEAKDGELKGFAVCGEDKKFQWAKAEIKGDTVVVTCDKIDKPVAVRYGWANCPVVNLWNKDGLPATPFRTDDFPMTTKK